MGRLPKQLSPSWILRFLCGPFLIGILFASYGYAFPSGPGEPFLFWTGLVLTGVLSFFVIRQAKRDTVLVSIGLALLGFSIAWGWYGVMTSSDGAMIESSTDFLQGEVVAVDRSTDRQKLYLTTNLVRDRVLVFAPSHPEIRYGDSIQMNCDLKRAEPFDGFRYDRFLASKDVFYTCFLYESPVITSRDGGNIFLRTLSKKHEGISTRIDEMFGDPHAALLAGLLLGDQRFTDTWDKKFQATGTTHIVAASGYNVTVVVFVLFSILVYFGLRRQYAYGLLLIGIILYVFLAGADAPIVRAGIMGALVLTAKQLGRKTSMTNILLLAAVAMLLFEPRLLRDDVGFQLSALSTVALVYFASPVEKFFSFVPKAAALRESLSATVAATLFTLPIILFSFGQFSLLSPIANLLILPVLPYAMALGALALIVGAVSFSLGVFVAGPAWALLSYVLWVIDALSSLPFTSIDL